MSEYQFSAEEEQRFASDLEVADRVFDSVVGLYHLKAFQDAGRGWPGRSYRRRKGLKTYWLRLILDAESRSSGALTWTLYEVLMYDYGEFYRKIVSSRFLATSIDRSGLRDSHFQQTVEDALSRNFVLRSWVNDHLHSGK